MLAANRILNLDSLPRIFLELLDAEAHLALVAVESEDNGLNFVANVHELLSRAQVLAPRHLRNVDQAFNARSNLNECTVVGDDNNLTLHVVTHLELAVESIPRMRSELLQTESDALLLVIEVEDNDIDLLVEGNNLVRIAYAAPRKVGDVDESVNTAEVNEYTVRSDVLDGTFENLTLFELADDFFLLLFQFGLDESLVRNNNVAEFLVDLHHLELHRLAYEYIVVAYGMNVDLATWQEGLDAEYINNHTTLCAALDVTLDNLFVVQSSIHALPALGEAGFLVREQQLAFLVLLVLHINLNNVAYLQVGIVTELRSGNNTVALVADVHDNLFLVEGDYLTLYHLVLTYLVQGLIVSLGECILADVHCRTILKLFPVEFSQWLYVLKI